MTGRRGAGRSGGAVGAMVPALTLLTTLTTPRTAEAAPELFTFGAGLLGSAGGVWLDRPDSTTLELPSSGDPLTYPAFAGHTFGGGVFVEGRLFEIVGVEVDFLYAPESLGGDATRAGQPLRITLSQPAFRIPILAKGVLPLGAFSPFLAAGPELVFYGLSSARTAPGERLGAVASANPSVWALFAAGVEWAVPALPVDLRIPLSMRLGWNPSVSDDLDERATALPSDAVVFESAPRLMAALTLGAGLYF
jgi:hypothetical protein